MPPSPCQTNRMKRLTATICLTLAVLLGSAGMNYVSSRDLNPNRDDRSIWKGTEWEKRIDGWVYKIKFNDSGDQYSVNITGPLSVAPCSGRVEQDGTLSLSTCTSYDAEEVLGGTPRFEIDGNVDAINLSVSEDPIAQFGNISNSVTFDELERKLAGLEQKETATISIRDDRSIWKGTEWEKRIGAWVYKITFSNTGNEYTVLMSHRLSLGIPCSGKVSITGTLSLITCSPMGGYDPSKIELSGTVYELIVTAGGNQAFEDAGLSDSLIKFGELERRLAGFKQEEITKVSGASRYFW